jgi:1-acyl-sn-glycerol-3-phosphate acyltransferase
VRLPREAVELPRETERALRIQREVGRLLSPVWILGAAFILRFVFRYRIQNAKAVRERFRALVGNTDAPILICPNHLTMSDSAIVTWALGGSWWNLFHYRWVPWNVPEYHNFAGNFFSRVAAWVTKCIPIIRGGPREHVSAVLKKIEHLVSRGETAIIFPEGGRSRTGRIQVESLAHGTGRIVNAIPGCHVLCVYLRGDQQESWSTMPARGDSFYLDFELFRPESEANGMRRSRDFAHQIGDHLVRLEERYFASR